MFDFPSSPTVGQLYPVSPSAGQPQYTWDGEKWTSGTGLGAIFISDTAPAAGVGSLWWESDTGNLYVRYNDGDSLQWVMCSQAGTPSGVVRYDAAQTLTSAQKSQARANIDVMKKNYLINGAMMVSQENGATAGTVASYFPVDQFLGSFVNSGTQTFQQVAVTSPAGSPNRIRATATAADASVAAGDYCQLLQSIEGFRIADLRIGLATAKTITLQFGVKAPAGIYCIAFRNGAGNRSYVAEYVIAAGEANIDVVKSVTVALDQTGTWAVDNSAGISISFTLMGGTTFQTASGSWVAGNFLATANQFNFMGTNGNVFELFDVGLYEGTIAPTFQVPDYITETALCQRYFWKWAAPSAALRFALAYCDTTVNAQAIVNVPVPMRILPSIALAGLTLNGIAVTGGSISWFSQTVAHVAFNVASGLTANTMTQVYSAAGGGAFQINARM